MTAPAGRRGVILALGTAQTLAWASSYYLVAIVADPISRELGVSATAVFAAFSAALLVSAALGPAVGRAIDRRGGRGVLCLSNLVFAAGLALLAMAHGLVLLVLAWLVLGVGMALGLYDSAFATLAGLYRQEARGPITGITLLAGFASTVGWPLTAFLDANAGWRGACLVWAGLHLLVGLPLNRFLIPPRRRQRPVTRRRRSLARTPHRGARWRCWPSCSLRPGWSAPAWPRTSRGCCWPPAPARSAPSPLPPLWVRRRWRRGLVEFSLMRRAHPLVSARVAAVLHPAGAAALAVFGGPAAAAFTILHGAGNGLLTIAKGTLPLALFGPAGYGLRTGLLSAPARVAQAGAPLLFGLLLDRVGVGVLAASAGLGLHLLRHCWPLGLGARGRPEPLSSVRAGSSGRSAAHCATSATHPASQTVTQEAQHPN